MSRSPQTNAKRMREREVQMKRKAKMAKRLERKAHKRATKDDPKDPAARDVTAEFVTGIPAPDEPVSRASLDRQRRLVDGLPAGALAHFESTLRELQSRADAMLERQRGTGAGDAPAATTRAPRPKPTS
jgi:hypothetical protein